MTDSSSNLKSGKQEVNPLLKLALEMGPLMVFFFANSRPEFFIKIVPVLGTIGGPLFVATACFMAALTVSVILSWMFTRSIPVMPLVTLVFVLIMGGLTLWLQNETFIKMKPTVVNCLFGTALLVGLYLGRNFLKLVLDTAFTLDKEGWDKLALRWGLFFFVLAALNEIVWRNFSNDFWVGFKVWATIPITIAFTLSQMPLIMRHTIEQPDNVKSSDSSTD